MGNYLIDQRVGKHVTLKANGDVSTNMFFIN